MSLFAHLDLTKSQLILGTLTAVILLIVSLAISILIIVKLPADYFLENRDKNGSHDLHPIVLWSISIIKNIVGFALVIIGLIMIFTPGQGILTMLFGVMLLDFPGKRKIELKLIGLPRVLETLNRLRLRFGKIALILKEES